jgi:hypothetical protein
MSKKILLQRDILKLNDDYQINGVGSGDEVRYRQNKVLFKSKKNGKIVDEHETTNIVNINGSMFNAEKWLGYVPPAASLVYYDLDLNLNDKGTIPSTEITAAEKVYLFCMANTGCDNAANARKKTEYNSRIAPADLLPFRCVPTGTSIDSKYTGKKTIDGLDKYYFKEFDDIPQFRRISDNTVLTTLYEPTTKPIDTYSELIMSVTVDDFKEHFNLIGRPLDCMVSSMHLCSALKETTPTGAKYTRIRPVTLVHFMTEFLIEDGKALDIIYQLFF